MWEDRLKDIKRTILKETGNSVMIKVDKDRSTEETTVYEMFVPHQGISRGEINDIFARYDIPLEKGRYLGIKYKYFYTLRFSINLSV